MSADGSSQDANGGLAKRKRRPPGEARRLLVEVARRRFAENGYRDTSTRDIAEEANVSEGLLFRYFGTKKRLFHESVVDPFAADIADYVNAFDPTTPAQPFQEGLFRLLDSRRELLIALLSVNAFSPDVLETTDASPLQAVLQGLEDILVAELDLFGFEHVDAYLSSRICLATVLGLVFFDSWLFAGRERPGRERIINEMLVQIVHGLAHHPPPRSIGGVESNGG